MQLLKLGTDDAYYVSSLLQDRLFVKPAWAKLLKFDIALIFLLLLLSPFYPACLVWLMLPFAINMGLHFWNRNNSLQFIKSFPQLNILIHVCSSLIGNDIPFNKESVGKSIAGLKGFQAKRRLLSVGQSATGSEAEQVSYFFIEIVKAFFLIEVFAFFSLMKELQNKRDDIETLFAFAGGIDIALSIASLRQDEKATCTPVFTPAKKSLRVVNIHHPLIDGCVTNSINVQSAGVLITGSNMSGKTTFLRTIAINTLLAQTLNTCFADAFETPLVKLFSSVRIDDSLLDGKSFYFEEVNVMGELIRQVTTPGQSMFILDEVFKGTNTIERIAAAKAILSYLNKNNNLVFVATHDIELAALLSGQYDLYHFSEIVENEQLNFDHTLKTGPLTTRNAIKILALHKYPLEIITEAEQISVLLSQQGNKL